MGGKTKRLVSGVLAGSILCSGLAWWEAPVSAAPPREAPGQAAPGGPELPTPSGRLVWVDQGDLISVSPDGDEQVIIDGPYNWPAEIYTNGQISNPRWSPDGSMIAFNRAVIDPITGLQGQEIHVVFADGTGEQEVTERLRCTPPPDWPPGVECRRSGAWLAGWTPRGDGLVVSGGQVGGVGAVVSMFDPRVQEPVDANDLGECVPTIHYDSDIVPASWFFLGVDFRGRWIGQTDSDRWNYSPQQLEVRVPSGSCDGHRYAASLFHPVMSQAVSSRPIDAFDAWSPGHERGAISRDGTMYAHETRASTGGQEFGLPPGVAAQIDIESFTGAPTRRLEFPANFNATVGSPTRWSADGNGLIVGFSGGLITVDVETGATTTTPVPGFLTVTDLNGSFLEFDVQCVPSSCVPPPPCGAGMVRIGFFCESDSDADGITDQADNCPNDPNPDQLDGDLDGEGDVCDQPEPDVDADGLVDFLDNCEDDPNPDQSDVDDDGVGDVCDSLPDDPSNAPPCTYHSVSMRYWAELVGSFPLDHQLSGGFCTTGSQVRVLEPFTSTPSVPFIPGGLPLAIADAFLSLMLFDRNLTSAGEVTQKAMPNGSVQLSVQSEFDACISILIPGWGKAVGIATRFLGKHSDKIARWVGEAVERVSSSEVNRAAISELIGFLVGVVGLAELCTPVWTPTLRVLLKPDGTVVDQSSVENGRLGYRVDGALGVSATQLTNSDRQEAPQTESAALSATPVGDGMFMVGIDIEPGVYRAAVPTSSCVWWRLRGLEDNLDAVIANDATSWPAIVEIQPDDLAFESAGCGEWTSLEETPVTASPLADAPDGMYRVGTDLSPGVWTTAGGNPNCVWERRSGFGGTDDDAIEQAGSQWPQTVVLEPGDVGFASWNCGPWSFVAPTIGNVDPASAFVGDDVVISGTALQAVTGVSFNGTPATEFSVSPMGAVEAVVPTGATTGPVTVSTAGGDAVSPDNFTVLAGAPPVITSFGPPSGSVGDSVFINGANFTGTTAVAFNGVAATTFFVVSDSAISAAVPEGASTGPISVTTLVTTRSSTTSFTVAGPPVNQAPYASFISPAGATPVRGVVRLQVDAFDGETQVDRVEFFADGEPIGTATELDGELSWSIRWNSTGFADGQTHAVEAVAYDTEELGSVPAQLSLVVEPVTAMDFDGDGAADRSVFRPQYGGWFVDGGATEFLGLSGDVPVPGDYDGDGTTERAVFRDGAWFIEGEPTRFLGAPGDIPVPGDYDGDGVMEPAVFRDGAWYIEGQPTRYWGSPGDVPVPADYDGDGTSEAAVFRAEVGAWYVEDEATVFFGLESDVPVPGDYDGDGRTDRAVFRPQVGGWYVDGQLTEFIGLDSDVPVPADYDGDGIVERAVFRPQVGGWYVQDAVTVFYGLDTDVPLLLPAAIYNARY